MKIEQNMAKETDSERIQILSEKVQMHLDRLRSRLNEINNLLEHMPSFEIHTFAKQFDAIMELHSRSGYYDSHAALRQCEVLENLYGDYIRHAKKALEEHISNLNNEKSKYDENEAESNKRKRNFISTISFFIQLILPIIVIFIVLWALGLNWFVSLIIGVVVGVPIFGFWYAEMGLGLDFDQYIVEKLAPDNKSDIVKQIDADISRWNEALRIVSREISEREVINNILTSQEDVSSTRKDGHLMGNQAGEYLVAAQHFLDGARDAINNINNDDSVEMKAFQNICTYFDYLGRARRINPAIDVNGLNINNSVPDGLMTMAMIHVGGKGTPLAAIACLEAAIALEEKAVYHFIVGQLYSRINVKEPSFYHLQRATELEPLNDNYRAAFDHIGGTSRNT